MSFINDNVLIKYHSDLVINWDSSSKEEYILNKKNFLELDRILSNIKKDPQKRFHYNNGIFQRSLVQYYMLIYSCLNNRTWFQFQNLSLIDKYLTQGKKLIDLSRIPWSKIFSVDKTRSTKFDTLISIVDGQLYPILRSLKCLEKEEISFKYNIFKLIFVTQHLNTGGNFIIKMYNYFSCKTLDYLYLLLFFFDKVYIINYSLYMAIGYNPKINVNTEDFFNNLLHRDFTITPKRELPEIIKYLDRGNIGRIETCQLLEKSDINAFIKERHYHYINLLIERNFWISKNSILNLLPVTKQINMDQDKYDILYYLETDFQKSLRKKNSQVISINNCGINKIERQVLKKIFSKNRHLQKCLAINIGTGVTCLEMMIQMFKIKTTDSTLYLIDQFQKESWDNYGLRLLQQSGIPVPIELFVQPSYQSLAKLEKKMPGSFNLIYLGGRYNYENIDTDFFYVYKLLSPEGLLIIDFLFDPMIEELITSIEKEESYQLDIVEKNNLVAVYRKKH